MLVCTGGRSRGSGQGRLESGRLVSELFSEAAPRTSSCLGRRLREAALVKTLRRPKSGRSVYSLQSIRSLGSERPGEPSRGDEHKQTSSNTSSHYFSHRLLLFLAPFPQLLSPCWIDVSTPDMIDYLMHQEPKDSGSFSPSGLFALVKLYRDEVGEESSRCLHRQNHNRISWWANSLARTQGTFFFPVSPEVPQARRLRPMRHNGAVCPST